MSSRPGFDSDWKHTFASKDSGVNHFDETTTATTPLIGPFPMENSSSKAENGTLNSLDPIEVWIMVLAASIVGPGRTSIFAVFLYISKTFYRVDEATEAKYVELGR